MVQLKNFSQTMVKTFANQEFIDMCEAMNIIVKTTAAEAPFSSGLIERHNFILSEMLDKTLEDNRIDLELALAWCINVKNSLATIHGSSPFQLALGQNPCLPSTFVDKLPALTPVATNKILADNLTALHKAREALSIRKL